MLKKFIFVLGLAVFLTGCSAEPVSNTSNTSDANTSTASTSTSGTLSSTSNPSSTTESVSDEHAHHDDGSTTMTTATSISDRLNKSPRHQEWVEIRNGDKTIHTWVVYPETSEKRPVVLLIHENRGLNDWARSMADQVAEAGYVAVAPDLLSDFSDTQKKTSDSANQIVGTEKRTSDFANEDAARTALSTLDPKQVMSDLKKVADWSLSIPATNGKLVSAGFCWGGAQSFQLATEYDKLASSMVFYGTGPTDVSVYGKIKAPVYGFYGGADERVNATIEKSEEQMKAGNKTFDYVIYEGAGHAFMRSGEEANADPANATARNAAWKRMKDILEKL